MAKNDQGSVDAALVRQLAELLDETGLNEIEIGRGDMHVRVSKGGGQVVHASVPAAAPAAAAPVDSGDSSGESATPAGAVTSPMVGVVYLSPDPGSDVYVTVGDQVAEGDTLCLIEAMKVFNPIRSPRAGKVTRILVNSGSPVEFGEALIVIE